MARALLLLPSSGLRYCTKYLPPCGWDSIIRYLKSRSLSFFCGCLSQAAADLPRGLPAWSHRRTWLSFRSVDVAGKGWTFGVNADTDEQSRCLNRQSPCQGEAAIGEPPCQLDTHKSTVWRGSFCYRRQPTRQPRLYRQALAQIPAFERNSASA